jgi:hypothetical protein
MWKSLFIFLLGTTFTIKAFSQVKEEFDNISFYLPQGLTMTKTENTLTLIDPTLPTGQSFTITINKCTFSLKKIEKSFPVFWKESLLADGIDNPGEAPSFVKAKTSSGWSWFRGGKLVQSNEQAPATYYYLTVLKYTGITALIITRSSSEELFLQKNALLIQLISSINLKTQPASGTPNQ